MLLVLAARIDQVVADIRYGREGSYLFILLKISNGKSLQLGLYIQYKRISMAPGIMFTDRSLLCT